MTWPSWESRNEKSSLFTSSAAWFLAPSFSSEWFLFEGDGDGDVDVDGDGEGDGGNGDGDDGDGEQYLYE